MTLAESCVGLSQPGRILYAFLMGGLLDFLSARRFATERWMRLAESSGGSNEISWDEPSKDDRRVSRCT